MFYNCILQIWDFYIERVVFEKIHCSENLDFYRLTRLGNINVLRIFNLYVKKNNQSFLIVVALINTI